MYHLNSCYKSLLFVMWHFVLCKFNWCRISSFVLAWICVSWTRFVFWEFVLWDLLAICEFILWCVNLFRVTRDCFPSREIIYFMQCESIWYSVSLFLVAGIRVRWVHCVFSKYVFEFISYHVTLSTCSLRVDCVSFFYVVRIYLSLCVNSLCVNSLFLLREFVWYRVSSCVAVWICFV